MNMVMMIKKA